VALGDGVAATFFLHDAEGRTLVRPFRRWGRTYVVPPEQEDAVGGYIQAAYLLMLAAVMVAERAFGLMAALGLVPVLTAAFLAGLAWRLRRFPVTDAAPVETKADLQVAFARSLGRRRVAVTLAICAVFAVCGVWMALGGDRDGWAVAALFGLGVAVEVRTLLLLRRADRAGQG
jgi:hypothetical protein